MDVKHLVEGFGEVLSQVEAIRNLDCVGGALPGAVRIGSGAIAADHVDAGMRLSPQGHGLGLTIGQEGERSMPLEINQDGPIGLTFPNGPVVDAEHLGGATSGRGRRRHRRTRGLRLTRRPRRRLRRPPAVPASAPALGTSHCASRCLRRAPGATRGASRSVKMRRGQRPFAQTHFRTRQWSTTRHDPQGWSATVRTSRRCIRRVGNRQTGQWTRACIDVPCHVSGVVVSSRCQGSRCHGGVAGSP